jgi:hypothetical protein
MPRHNAWPSVKTMSIYDFINPGMNCLLRSPWHHLFSKRIMSVSYPGRKSGKRYNTPISYYRSGDKVYCFTNGVWRYNFSTASAATLRIAGRNYPARGKVFEGGREQLVDIMGAYFKAVPQDKKFYGIRGDATAEPSRTQVEQALGSIVIIEFTLQ